LTNDAVNEAKAITAHKTLVIFTLKKLYDVSFDFKESKTIIRATNTSGNRPYLIIKRCLSFSSLAR
jgi:hypothetical protein